MEEKHKLRILLTGHSNLDITKLVADISFRGMENKIDNATLKFSNDISQDVFVEQFLKIGDLIEIDSLDPDLDDPMLMLGQIVDKSPEVTNAGSFITFTLYAFPAIGLNRMRATEIYYNRKLREILVEPLSNIKNDFPFYPHEYYTENHATGGSPPYFGDWHIHAVGGYASSTMGDVTSYTDTGRTWTPKMGSKFVVMSVSSSTPRGTLMNFEFPRVGVDYANRFPMFIDSWSDLRWNPINGSWSNIPYIDVWMFTADDTGYSNADIRIQLKIDDSNYIYIPLTTQHALGTDDVNLLPNDGEWHHLIIPIGSKWGRGEIRVDPVWNATTNEWEGGNLVSDVGGTPKYDGEPIKDRTGWILSTGAGASSSSWNGIMSISLACASGLTGAINPTFGVDGLTIRNLGNPYAVVEDDVKRLFHLTPSKYASINTDYIYNDSTIVPYLNLCYAQATKCIMNTLDTLTALKFPSPSLHWRMTSRGELLIAPINNHNVNGIDSSHVIEDKWSTVSHYDQMHPLKIGEDIVSTRFQQKEPEYNFIIINGVYQYPQNNYWCSDLEIVTSLNPADEVVGKWFNTLNGLSGTMPSPLDCKHSGDCVVGPYSIAYPSIPQAIPLANISCLILDIPDDLLLDPNLISEGKVTFWIKCANISGVEMRLYTDKFGYSAVTDDTTANYFYKGGTGTTIGSSDGAWHKIEWNLGPDGGWMVKNYATWSKNIRRIYFKVTGGMNPIGPAGYLYIDGLNINGKTIRAAASFNNVNKYGAKMGLINESLVAGNSLSTTEYDPLDYVAVQEVIRSIGGYNGSKSNPEPPYYGSVEIELDTKIQAGQIIYLQSPAFGYESKPFRILWFEHRVNTSGAITTIYVTDDLTNAYVRDPSNLESIAIKTIMPDYQNRNFARLAVSGIDSRTPLVKIVNVDNLG